MSKPDPDKVNSSAHMAADMMREAARKVAFEGADPAVLLAAYSAVTIMIIEMGCKDVDAALNTARRLFSRESFELAFKEREERDKGDVAQVLDMLGLGLPDDDSLN